MILCALTMKLLMQQLLRLIATTRTLRAVMYIRQCADAFDIRILYVLFAISKVLRSIKVNYFVIFLHWKPDRMANKRDVNSDFVHIWHM